VEAFPEKGSKAGMSIVGETLGVDINRGVKDLTK
jgi:hypothetical protein